MNDETPWNRAPEGLASVREFAHRGACCLAGMQYQRAAKEFTKAILLEPMHPKLYHWRRVAYRGWGKETEAVGDEQSVAQAVRAVAETLQSWQWPSSVDLRIKEKLCCLCWLYLDDGWALNPPLAENVLTSVEGTFGVRLPEDYRYFMLRIGDGGAGPGAGLAPFEDAYNDEVWTQRGDIRKPFPLEEPWKPDRGMPRTDRIPAPGEVNDGCLVLSYDGCEYVRSSFLIVTGKERGRVWDDHTDCVGGGLEPTGKEFLDWYEGWLDAKVLAWRNGRCWEKPWP